MLVAGAKGHALELLDILIQMYKRDTIVLFDSINDHNDIETLNQFKIIKTEAEVEDVFKKDNQFVLGIGNSMTRKKLADYLTQKKGVLLTVISPYSIISDLNVKLGNGINIMHSVIIQPEVSIGNGTLINAGAIIHHQSTIGQFCEICPRATITGNVQIGDFTMIGAGAVILPGIKIGSGVRVGAGAIVVKDINDNETVSGNPAKLSNK